MTFTLTVTNTGDASALGVKVCDELPASLSLVSAPGFSLAGGRALPFRRDPPARRIEDIKIHGARIPGRTEPDREYRDGRRLECQERLRQGDDPR